MSENSAQIAVVVSAIGGKPKVTDMLIDCITLAASGNVAGYKAMLEAIRAKHAAFISELLAGASQASARAEIEAVIAADITEISDLCRAAQLLKNADNTL